MLVLVTSRLEIESPEMHLVVQSDRIVVQEMALTDEKKHSQENSVSSKDELTEGSEASGLPDESLNGDNASEAISESNDSDSEDIEVEVVYSPQEDGAEGSTPAESSKDGDVADQDDEAEFLEEDLFVSPDDSDVELVELGQQASDGAPEDEALQEALEAKKAEVAELEARVRSLEEGNEVLGIEKEELNTRLLRSMADLENYRRRSEREKEELRKYGVEKVVADLVPAVDNMERALNHAQEQGESNSLVEGIEMVHRQILGTLKKYGVVPFDSKAEPFDPQRHEAIQQVESTEVDTGTIVEEYQKGYFIHDRLLRPALVVVAKRVEAVQSDDGGESSKDVDEAVIRETEEDSTSGDVEEGAATKDDSGEN